MFDRRVLMIFSSFFAPIDSVSVRQIMNEDDDIIAGPQKMSLGCPVCRSSISVSIQI